MIFVDSSAWFARYTPRDVHHAAAQQFVAQVDERLVTSDYVIDEVLTLLKVRGNVERAARAGKAFFGGELAQIEWASQSDILRAWEIFDKYRDKQWSFTDCVSLVQMQRLGITNAFAFDDHFRQFGSVAVFP